MAIDPEVNVFELPPCRAGLEGAWMLGKAFLIPALLAMPFVLFRNDWTWLQFLQALGVSVGIGFLPCFVGSLLWHSIGEVPYLRKAVCYTLPMPLGVLPCLSVFATEVFDSLAFSLFVGSWLLLIAALIVLPPIMRFACRLYDGKAK